MMRPIVMKVLLFDSPDDSARSRKAMLTMLEALCKINVGWLQSLPRRERPSLYRSDVIYQAEVGTEEWLDIPHILVARWGDCEDLACWRVAELRVAGIEAHPYIRWKKRPGSGARYHALVWRPGGRIEDPSLALGMRNHPITRKPVYV